MTTKIDTGKDVITMTPDANGVWKLVDEVLQGAGKSDKYTPPPGGGGVTNTLIKNGKTITFGHGGRREEALKNLDLIIERLKRLSRIMLVN